MQPGRAEFFDRAVFGRARQSAARRGFGLPACAALLTSGAAAWLALRSPLHPAAFVLWILALTGLLWAAWRHDWPPAQPFYRQFISRPSAQEALLLAGITLLAFGLRAWNLTQHPAPFHGDEGEMGRIALNILHGQPVPPFATGWFGHPNLFFYMQAASLKVWGSGEAGLRMLSAVWGAASVPLIYWLGRAGWGRAAGFTAAWLLAVSHLHIHFSRMALNNVHSTTAMIALLLFFVLAQQDSRRAPALLYVGAGLVLGLSQYLYFGSFLLLVVSVPLLWGLWRSRRASLQDISSLLAGAAAAYAPLGSYYAAHWQITGSRARTVSILSEQNVQHTLGSSASLPADWLALLQHQLVQNLSFFTGSGDRSSFYAAELASFDQITLVFFWAGLVLALASLRRFQERALLLWLAAGVLLAGVLTINAPYAPRLLLAVPAVYLLAGVFVQRVWSITAGRKSWLPALQKVAGPAFAAAAAALAAAVLITNVRTYFIEYHQLENGLVPVLIAREMAAEPRPEMVFLAGAPHLYANHGTIQFIAWAAAPRDLDSSDQLTAAYQSGQGVLVVAVSQRAPDLDAIMQQFPGGTLTTRTDRHGQLIYSAYRMPAGLSASSSRHWMDR